MDCWNISIVREYWAASIGERLALSEDLSSLAGFADCFVFMHHLVFMGMIGGSWALSLYILSARFLDFFNYPDTLIGGHEDCMESCLHHPPIEFDVVAEFSLVQPDY